MNKSTKVLVFTRGLVLLFWCFPMLSKDKTDRKYSKN